MHRPIIHSLKIEKTKLLQKVSYFWDKFILCCFTENLEEGKAISNFDAFCWNCYQLQFIMKRNKRRGELFAGEASNVDAQDKSFIPASSHWRKTQHKVKQTRLPSCQISHVGLKNLFSVLIIWNWLWIHNLVNGHYKGHLSWWLYCLSWSNTFEDCTNIRWLVENMTTQDKGLNHNSCYNKLISPTKFNVGDFSTSS